MANMINADLDKISVVNKTWKEQINYAMRVNGGETAAPKPFDYIKHVVAFPWKVYVLKLGEI